MEKSKQVHQGAGSAENTNGDRNEQKQPLTNVNNDQKRRMGEDIDECNHTIADLGELGMAGGRGDHSGGFGDSKKKSMSVKDDLNRK